MLECYCHPSKTCIRRRLQSAQASTVASKTTLLNTPTQCPYQQRPPFLLLLKRTNTRNKTQRENSGHEHRTGCCVGPKLYTAYMDKLRRLLCCSVKITASNPPCVEKNSWPAVWLLHCKPDPKSQLRFDILKGQDMNCLTVYQTSEDLLANLMIFLIDSMTRLSKTCICC